MMNSREYIDGYLPSENARIRAAAASVLPLTCPVTGQIMSVDALTGTACVQPDNDMPLLPHVRVLQHVTAAADDRCLLIFAENDIRKAFVAGILRQGAAQ